jgi:hypothetical protein
MHRLYCVDEMIIVNDVKCKEVVVAHFKVLAYSDYGRD